MARNKKANVRFRRQRDGEIKYFDVLEMNWMPTSFLTQERLLILYSQTAF